MCNKTDLEITELKENLCFKMPDVFQLVPFRSHLQRTSKVKGYLYFFK